MTRVIGKRQKRDVSPLFLTLQDVERRGNRLKHTHTHTHTFSPSTQPHCGILHHGMSQEPEIQFFQLVEEKLTVSYKTQEHKSGLWARKSLSRDCQERGGCAGGNVRMCLTLLAACSGCPCPDLGQGTDCLWSPCSGVSLLKVILCFDQSLELSEIRIMNNLLSPQ